MAKLTESYVKGRDEPPLIEDTIGRRFDLAAERWGEREALVSAHQGVRWTYKELKEKVDAYAAGMLAMGLKRGDRVGIWSHNNWEWLVTQFATAKAGIILVNINPAYQRAEVTYALNKVGCKAVIAMPSFRTSHYLEMLQDIAPELNDCEPGQLHAAKLPELRLVVRLGEERTPGMMNFSEIPEQAKPAHFQELDATGGELDRNDAINIQFTSGTTGNPKGATLTHRNILNNGFFVGECIRLTEQDRLCTPVPLYHCFGMVMANLACMTHGSCVIYASEAFEPEAVLRTVEKERCTALYGVPTMFIAEMGVPDFKNYDLSSLRTGIMAGSICPMEVMKRVVDEMHMSEVTIAYGMTETSPVSFQSSTEDPLERRVSTVGLIHPHLEVKIIDENGNTTAPGVPGELCTRGYSVMLGYWNDEEKTREAIDEDGWMHTGDIGTIDEEGYCQIVGRMKDMVIRGGENIYPKEVEDFFYTHEAVEDVQVVGLPDEHYGEVLCAWIRVKAGFEVTEEEIREYGRGQIAHYKIPHYIRFVEEYPMTVTGKVRKYLIREQMIAELEETKDE